MKWFSYITNPKGPMQIIGDLNSLFPLFWRNMTDDKKMFIKFQRREQGFVTIWDNNKGKILGTGDIGGKDTLAIKNMLYVEGLKDNLLRNNQLFIYKGRKSMVVT